jgi:hypothetical protein
LRPELHSNAALRLFHLSSISAIKRFRLCHES